METDFLELIHTKKKTLIIGVVDNVARFLFYILSFQDCR